MAPYEQRIYDNIARVGWHVTCVGPAADSDDPEEWFAYTVGLGKTFGRPELICFGLELQLLAALLNDAVEECRSKNLTPTADLLLVDVIDGHPARLVDNLKIADSYTNSARWFARREGLPPPAVLQMLWPDERGLFPDEPGCSEEVRALQTPVERS